jgi:hypothetical protein
MKQETGTAMTEPGENSPLPWRFDNPDYRQAAR